MLVNQEEDNESLTQKNFSPSSERKGGNKQPNTTMEGNVYPRARNKLALVYEKRLKGIAAVVVVYKVMNLLEPRRLN